MMHPEDKSGQRTKYIVAGVVVVIAGSAVTYILWPWLKALRSIGGAVDSALSWIGGAFSSVGNFFDGTNWVPDQSLMPQNIKGPLEQEKDHSCENADSNVASAIATWAYVWTSGTGTSMSSVAQATTYLNQLGFPAVQQYFKAAILNKASDAASPLSSAASNTYWCAHKWLSASSHGAVFTVPAGYIVRAMWVRMFGIDPPLSASNPF